MRPIRHEGSNFVYRGPSDEVGDLWVQRQPVIGCVEVIYELTDDDRQTIAEGGFIRLGIWTEPIPPVSMAVIPGEQVTKVEDQKFRVPDEDLPKRPVKPQVDGGKTYG